VLTCTVFSCLPAASHKGNGERNRQFVYIGSKQTVYNALIARKKPYKICIVKRETTLKKKNVLINYVHVIWPRAEKHWKKKNPTWRISILSELENISLDRYTNMEEISHTTTKFAFTLGYKHNIYLWYDMIYDIWYMIRYDMIWYDIWYDMI
jgi:hypothetical protein